MLNPHFNMHCLHLDAQINLEIVTYLVDWWTLFFLCLRKLLLWENCKPLKIVHHFNDLSTHILINHDKMRM